MNNSGSRSGTVHGQPWDSSCPTQPISTTPGGKKQAPTVLSEDWGLQIPDLTSVPDPAASTMSGPLLPPPDSPEKVPLPVSWGQRKLKASCDLGGEAREGPSRREGPHMLQACLSWLTDTQTDTRTHRRTHAHRGAAA